MQSQCEDSKASLTARGKHGTCPVAHNASMDEFSLGCVSIGNGVPEIQIYQTVGEAVGYYSRRLHQEIVSPGESVENTITLEV